MSWTTISIFVGFFHFLLNRISVKLLLISSMLTSAPFLPIIFVQSNLIHVASSQVIPFIFFSKNAESFTVFCVYTPQQNRIVECKHNHIGDVGRCFLNQGSLPSSLWVDEFTSMVFIINIDFHQAHLMENHLTNCCSNVLQIIQFCARLTIFVTQ